MTAILQLIKKHPVALALYCFYTAMCCRMTALDWEFHAYMKQHPGVSGIAAGGEMAAWRCIGNFFIGALFFLICGCLAIAYKKETKFYLLLALIAVLQPIVFLYAGDATWH